MPWLVEVTKVETLLDDAEKALYACGQMMAAGVLRAKFSHAVPMIFLSDESMANEPTATLTIPNHGGNIE